MPEIDWPVLFTGAFLSLMLVELTDWLPKLAERLIIAIARHYPQRGKIREAEWLAILDEIPGKFSKLIFASSCTLSTLKAQENPLFSLLNIFIGTMFLAARIVFVYLIPLIAYETLKDVLFGDVSKLPSAALFIGFALASFPKKEYSDFSWYPEWNYSRKSSKIVLLIFSSGLIGKLFYGSMTMKALMILMIVALSLSVFTTFKSEIAKINR